MESIEITASEFAEIAKDTLRLFGSRGTIEIITMFCCSNKRVRFSDLTKLLSHISTKTLTSRLRMLENYGILNRTAYNEIPPRVEYSMTEKGQRLADAMAPLIAWVIASKDPKRIVRARQNCACESSSSSPGDLDVDDHASEKPREREVE